MKKKRICISIGLMCLILSGCSSLPISLMPNMGQEYNQGSFVKVTEENTLQEENLLNHPIRIEFEMNQADGSKVKQAAEYTFLDVKIYPNFAATKFPTDKRWEPEDELNRYGISPSVNDEDISSVLEIPINLETYPVLVARAKIKNISTPEDFHTDDFQFEYRNPKDDYIYSEQVIYFDKMLDHPTQSFHIPIEIGEEKEVTLAWVLASKDLDLENYYIDLKYNKKVPVTRLIDKEKVWEAQ